MTTPNAKADSMPGAAIEPELAALEQRLALLIAHARTLRTANAELRRELAVAESRNQALAERVAEAKRRLDALLARLPEPAE